ATGPQGPKGDKGDTGNTGATGPQGPKGDTGDTGPKGDTGAAGADGDDGISCTHSWSGTVLSVTSASGTSSADLVGPQGPTGATGPTGPAGADGTTFTPQSPLSLSNGVLSVDLSGCAGASDLHPRLWLIQNVGYVAEGSTQAIDASYSGITDIAVGDWVLHTIQGTLSIVTAMSGPTYVTLKGILELPALQGIVPTTALDLAAGASGNAYDGNVRRRVRSGTLLLNPTTGALMQANRDCNALNGGGCFLYGTGIGNVFGGGSSYTASSPLSIDANNDISIDLSAYAALAGATFTGAVSGIAPTANAHFATKKYVDDAIAALDDLSGVNF
ncbi:MAG: collagen-like protein, partial [Olsenella sp.]|nr:collagen-like protein [Olsenella sp.]